MVRAYPLYFDRPTVDRERRTQRAAAAGIIALHAVLLLWLLLSPQGQRTLDTATHLVVIELGDAPARPEAKSHAAPSTANRRAEPPGQLHSANAAAATVRSPSSVIPLPAGNGSTLASAAGTVNGSGATGPAKDGARAGAMRYHFRPPQTLHSWLPPYPEDAFRANHQGAVDLLVTIAADGKLVAARVDRSSGNASLDRAALESLDRYTFKAAERDGAPVRADAIVTINWIISDAVIERFGSPRIERIDPLNLTRQQQQTQYGSYLKALQRERDNDPDSH
jgi:TonB family protein